MIGVAIGSDEFSHARLPLFDQKRATIGLFAIVKYSTLLVCRHCYVARFADSYAEARRGSLPRSNPRFRFAFPPEPRYSAITPSGEWSNDRFVDVRHVMVGNASGSKDLAGCSLCLGYIVSRVLTPAPTMPHGFQ
jgi:hypothetical protein